MIQVTKIFRFETAHAINGYAGSCRNVHGHSYELHVTVVPATRKDDYLAAPGFVIDFKELKKLVNQAVIDEFDHRLILSEEYLKHHPSLMTLENLVIWEMEPTAENILLYIRNVLQQILPEEVILHKLRIYETADSYAEWEKRHLA